MLLQALLLWQGAGSAVIPPSESGGLTARVHVGPRANGVLAIDSTNPVRVRKVRNVFSLASPTGAVVTAALYDRFGVVVLGAENLSLPYAPSREEYRNVFSRDVALVPGPYITRVTIASGETVLQIDKPCIARRLP